MDIDWSVLLCCDVRYHCVYATAGVVTIITMSTVLLLCVLVKVTASVVLAIDPEVRVVFPALPDFLRSSGSGTGSTQPHEKLLGRKSSGSGLESCSSNNRDSVPQLSSSDLLSAVI
jgi:hypothetical protein